MKVVRLSISNFRGVKSATLLFERHALLIAANKTGKSTVALDLALNVGCALAQEQIMGEHVEPLGVQVMNIYKAKGKQFDGVIFVREQRILPSKAKSSFVWRGDRQPYAKSRQLVRVGATRAVNIY